MYDTNSKAPASYKKQLKAVSEDCEKVMSP